MANNLSSKLNEKMDDAEEALKEKGEVIKESGQDWLQYVLSHPLQSILFGAVIGLAIKGLLK